MKDLTCSCPPGSMTGWFTNRNIGQSFVKDLRLMTTQSERDASVKEGYACNVKWIGEHAHMPRQSVRSIEWWVLLRLRAFAGYYSLLANFENVFWYISQICRYAISAGLRDFPAEFRIRCLQIVQVRSWCYPLLNTRSWWYIKLNLKCALMKSFVPIPSKKRTLEDQLEDYRSWLWRAS